MTTMEPSTNGRLTTLGMFAGSVLLGLFGGLLVLSGGWLLVTATPVGPQIALFLGLTSQTAWHLARSAGTVAYLLLAGSTVWGLLLSTKIIKETVPAVLALAMHTVLSWLAVALTGVHALSLLFDSYYTYSLADLTIPFIGPYRPGWVGLGILSLYVMVIASLSFNFRKQLGQKRWRQLHYLTFAVYVAATVHGVMAGTDSGKPGMQLLYWGSGLLVLFLTNYRLLVGKTAR